MPKLSHLRCFVMVARTGGISSAAKLLHRSPSAISMTLSNLESELGRNLFEADSKSHLTPFGAYVFEVSEDQIIRFDGAIERIEAFARNDFGCLLIGTVPSFASHYLPDLLAAYSERFPQVNLNLRDDSSISINRLVASGEIDVGIASPTDDEALKSVNCEPLMSDPIGVVCSLKNELTQLNRPLTWPDLAGQTFIVNGTCRRIKDLEFQKLIESSEIEVKNTTSLLAMVSANVGVTSLPRLAIPEQRKDVVFLSTAYDDLDRSIGILTSAERSLSPAAVAFVDMLQQFKQP